MNRDQLIQSLQNLHEQLQHVEDVDSRSREKLDAMIGDIERSLEDEKKQVASPRHKPLRESLEDSVEYFEVSHPNLTSVINHVISTLNAMGI